ncbi:unnamed protein product [Durusdinium trenchii]|uniref:Protein tweety homolog n=1 Tax=Durusdinium trenchii TaxID=1381693 RepID=A0ABP0MSF8_9DINO
MELPAFPTLPPIVRHPWEATWWVGALQRLGKEFPSPDSSEEEWKSFFVGCSAAPAAILAIGFVLTLLVLCCGCCRRETNHRRRAPSCVPSFCFGLLSVVMVLAGAFIYWETGSKALNTAQSELQNAYDNVTQAVSEGSKMKDVGASMLKNLDGIPLTCPFGIQQQVKQEVKKIANQVKTFNEAVDEFDNLMQPLPSKVKDVQDHASGIGQLTAAGLMAPLALVLLSCLTVIAAVSCSCTGRCAGCCLRSLGPLLMAPTVLVITVAAAVQLELGIVTSSFCENVDNNTLAFIGHHFKYDSEEYQLSKYYITGEGRNPLLVDLQNASEQLDDANQTISAYGHEVEKLCSWRGLEELQAGAAEAKSSLTFGWHSIFASPTWLVSKSARGPGTSGCTGAWRSPSASLSETEGI